MRKRNLKPTESARWERRMRLVGGATISALAREVKQPRQWVALREIGNVLMNREEAIFLVAAVARIAERRLEKIRLEVSRETKNASARESL
jgi:hypothetical protein